LFTCQNVSFQGFFSLAGAPRRTRFLSACNCYRYMYDGGCFT